MKKLLVLVIIGLSLLFTCLDVIERNKDKEPEKIKIAGSEEIEMPEPEYLNLRQCRNVVLVEEKSNKTSERIIFDSNWNTSKYGLPTAKRLWWRYETSKLEEILYQDYEVEATINEDRLITFNITINRSLLMFKDEWDCYWAILQIDNKRYQTDLFVRITFNPWYLS